MSPFLSCLHVSTCVRVVCLCVFLRGGGGGVPGHGRIFPYNVFQVSVWCTFEFRPSAHIIFVGFVSVMAAKCCAGQNLPHLCSNQSLWLIVLGAICTEWHVLDVLLEWPRSWVYIAR